MTGVATVTGALVDVGQTLEVTNTVTSSVEPESVVVSVEAGFVTVTVPTDGTTRVCPAGVPIDCV